MKINTRKRQNEERMRSHSANIPLHYRTNDSTLHGFALAGCSMMRRSRVRVPLEDAATELVRYGGYANERLPAEISA